jgi:hypothetical protein
VVLVGGQSTILSPFLFTQKLKRREVVPYKGKGKPAMKLERFGQALIDTDRLIAVKHHAADSNASAYSTLVFDTGQEVNISANDGRALIESHPNKACQCGQQSW